MKTEPELLIVPASLDQDIKNIYQALGDIQNKYWGLDDDSCIDLYPGHDGITLLMEEPYTGKHLKKKWGWPEFWDVFFKADAEPFNTKLAREMIAILSDGCKKAESLRNETSNNFEERKKCCDMVTESLSKMKPGYGPDDV